MEPPLDAASDFRQQALPSLRMLDGMTDLNVIAIPAARLDAVRAAAMDEHGNPLAAYPAKGWEPLRCCLRTAPTGEAIALISYSPFTGQSPWAEVGPVYIHAEQCAGYPESGELPAELRTGPRILRTYYDDGSLDYEDIAYVPEGEDVEPVLRDLLGRSDVAEVHVRASMSQCFTYAVRAGD